MLVLENDEIRTTPQFGVEFHNRLIDACRVETDRYLLVPVRVDEK